MTADVEDREIVALYWSRSEQALAETEARYGSYCRAIALRVLHSEQDAEECVNDAYLDVWNRIPPQKPDALGAFLGKIVRHIAIDRLRRRSAKKRGGGETPLALDELAECVPDRDGVEQTLERKALTELLNRFLAGLEPTERSVFLRRYWYIEPVADIANRFGFTESKVKSMLHRTRGKLRMALAEQGYFGGNADE